MDKEWYFIGLWLGDGAKNATSITSADIEIIEYLKFLSVKYNLKYNLYSKNKNDKAVEINLGGKQSYTREILKYDLNNNFICKYSSIKEAALNNNILASNISHAASNKYKHSGNFIWKYGNVIKHNPLRSILENLNLINNKHIPIEIFNETNLNKKLFLAGIIDSDGTKNYQTIYISQKDLNFIKDLEKLCISLGYKTKIKTRKVNEVNYYNLVLKGDLTDLPLLLKRKLPNKISKFNG